MKTGWEGILFLPTELINPCVTLGKINRPQEGVYVGSLWNQQLLQAAGLDRGQSEYGSNQRWRSFNGKRTSVCQHAGLKKRNVNIFFHSIHENPPVVTCKETFWIIVALFSQTNMKTLRIRETQCRAIGRQGLVHRVPSTKEMHFSYTVLVCGCKREKKC